ncbi:MAG: monofunctional biosynthetic peptidoglycan transglycosylase, partial [gamma proteobacterium symbiont of Ctena orbiculata]
MARKPRKKARFSRLYKRLSRWIFLLFIAFFTLLSALLLTLRFVDPPTWSWKLQREFNPPLDHSIESLHVWWDLAYIPAAMQLAVIASEDQNFPNHQGIDFNAVQQVLRDAERGRTLRGASTLTQQTVKNLFLWQRRDWSRKLLEGGLAFLLELMWNKERILEVYLNIVEFGPGVYGVAAASEYWYQLPLDRLTVNQMA